ncbi:hypothetical protein [Nonomuraea typhae]|uniref:Uncharacterized protein n=1 Tax=Nonomuraea typhae TaxID=2603600 RepID=A0ABW7YKA6_9ACTN
MDGTFTAMLHAVQARADAAGDIGWLKAQPRCTDGHAGTSVTEAVYRHQLRPVITKGARAMNIIFGDSRRVESE